MAMSYNTKVKLFVGFQTAKTINKLKCKYLLEKEV